jgi:lactocepin
MLKKLGAFGFLVVLILSLTLSGCFSFSVPDPSFTVEGVKDGQTYEQPVTPTIEPGKGTTLTITLNGEPFESGTTITQDGEYKLVIVAKNSRGKETTSEIEFTIELDVPLIIVTGVENGGYYWDAVTPNITTDGENDTIVVTLNGEEYTLGTPIEAHDK